MGSELFFTKQLPIIPLKNFFFILPKSVIPVIFSPGFEMF